MHQPWKLIASVYTQKVFWKEHVIDTLKRVVSELRCQPALIHGSSHGIRIFETKDQMDDPYSESFTNTLVPTRHARLGTLYKHKAQGTSNIPNPIFPAHERKSTTQLKLESKRSNPGSRAHRQGTSK